MNNNVTFMKQTDCLWYQWSKVDFAIDYRKHTTSQNNTRLKRDKNGMLMRLPKDAWSLKKSKSNDSEEAKNALKILIKLLQR